VKLFEFIGATKQYLDKTGSVDWSLGKISLPELNILTSTSEFKMFALPVSADVLVSKNELISIKESDVTIVMNPS